MNELVKITENEKGIRTVNARELHEFLNSKQDFSNWIKNKILKYDFVENRDFTLNKFVERKVTKIDYHISLDMAKELSMVENNEKGRQARRYFIECESKLQSLQIPQTYSQALLEAGRLAELNEKLELENKTMQPKADFYDTVTKSKDVITLGEASKVLNFKNIGRNKLFEILRGNKILDIKNIPYQKYVKRGYFKVVEVDTKNGIKLQTVVYQSGLDFINKLLTKIEYK